MLEKLQEIGENSIKGHLLHGLLCAGGITWLQEIERPCAWRMDLNVS